MTDIKKARDAYRGSSIAPTPFGDETDGFPHVTHVEPSEWAFGLAANDDPPTERAFDVPSVNRRSAYGKTPAGPEAFAVFLATVKSARTDADRTESIRRQASDYLLSCAQAGELLDCYRSRHDETERLNALRLLSPRIVDPQVDYRLLAKFPPEERHQVEVILNRERMPEITTEDDPTKVAMRVHNKETLGPVPDGKLDDFVRVLKSESDDSEKLRLLRRQPLLWRYSCAQAARVLGLFERDDMRMSALRVLEPRILDRREHVPAIEALFPVSLDKKVARTILTEYADEVRPRFIRP